MDRAGNAYAGAGGRQCETMGAGDETVETIELEMLAEAIFRRYGFDFRHYARASLKRRVRHCMRQEGVGTISALQERVLHDAACMERFLLALSVNVTAVFRDPGFYLTFRQELVPRLRTYPFIRIWHAGCASGEEVYSMAILLEEEGLYERVRVYATDMNEAVLARARDGIYPLERMREYNENYARAGGSGSLGDYYTAQYDRIIFRAGLKKNIVWAQHNLATDGSFNEFHVIVCRNVMIYFDRLLQARVHGLLYESLITFGFLGLGDKETIQFTPQAAAYEAVDGGQKWFRKLR